MPPKLGIIAGSGHMPRLMVEAAQKEKRDFFVIALREQADPALVENIPHKWIRLGAAGEGVAALKAEGCVDLVMTGGVRRPSLTELRPDWYTMKFFTRVGKAALGGDDQLLRAVREQFIGEGFNLLSPDDVMRSLLTSSGQLGKHAPDKQAQEDIERGIAVLNALAPVDVGQAVVVQEGLVLGVEAIEGTANLIRRTSELKRDGQGGVLVKLSKPQQHTKLDLPTIGPDTVDQCIAAGLRGIVIEASRSMLIDREVTIAKADATGLFIVAIENKP